MSSHHEEGMPNSPGLPQGRRKNNVKLRDTVRPSPAFRPMSLFSLDVQYQILEPIGMGAVLFCTVMRSIPWYREYGGGTRTARRRFELPWHPEGESNSVSPTRSMSYPDVSSPLCSRATSGWRKSLIDQLFNSSEKCLASKEANIF